MNVRTSETHPLRIDEIPCAPQASGVIGITFCPGKCGDSIYGAPWKRDLATDLDAVLAWGANAAVTLVGDRELHLLRVPGLGTGFAGRGVQWFHVPIRDLLAPDGAFHGWWDSEISHVLELLRSGGKVLVHCRGGLGRAGTVACMLLMELGVPNAEALARVRAGRAGAVETLAQEHYLASYSPRTIKKETP